MPDQYQFKTDFEPILLPGQTVQIKKADGQLGIRIEAVGALPTRLHDFGTVTSDTLGQEVTALEMGSGMLGQYRMVIRDKFELEMTHPDTTMRQWRNKSTNWRLGPIPVSSGDWGALDKFQFAASEFFVYEDETPRFDIYKLNSIPSVEAHVTFVGYRYKFSKLPNGKNGMFDLYVNSWPTGA